MMMVLEWFLCRQKYENENDDTSITRKQALQLGHIYSDVIRIQDGRQDVYRLAYRAYASIKQLHSHDFHARYRTD